MKNNKLTKIFGFSSNRSFSRIFFIYRQLMYVYNIKKSKTTINVSQIGFELRPYLIGLSFKRLFFQLNKLIFSLYLITNFLYGLLKSKVRLLLIGDDLYSYMYEIFKNMGGALFSGHDSFLLPGSVIGIQEAETYARDNGYEVFYNNFDCVFITFCIPSAQFLSEILHRSIPILGLIELDAPTSLVNQITYPIVAINCFENIFFFFILLSRLILI